MQFIARLSILLTILFIERVRFYTPMIGELTK